MVQPIKKKEYQAPRVQKHDSLKSVTQSATWNFNGPCYEHDANKGSCYYGFNCQPWP